MTAPQPDPLSYCIGQITITRNQITPRYGDHNGWETWRALNSLVQALLMIHERSKAEATSRPRRP